MGKTIQTSCGIFTTEYRLTSHRDGSCTVSNPYINKHGGLAFKKIKIKQCQAPHVKWFFENETTYNDGTYMTLDAEIYNPH